MADEDPVLLERQPVGEGDRTAAVVRLNRPDTLNPMDSAMLDALDAVLDEVEADPRVCAVLITGNGRAFSAGGVRMKSGCSGLKKARGCGSKVRAIAGARRFAASSSALSSTARWPRCSPSKLPMATTP